MPAALPNKYNLGFRRRYYIDSQFSDGTWYTGCQCYATERRARAMIRLICRGLGWDPATFRVLAVTVPVRYSLN